MLWEIDLHGRAGERDGAAASVAADAAALGLANELRVAACHGYLVQGPKLDEAAARKLARELFADPVAEEPVVAPIGHADLVAPPARLAAEGAVEPVLLVQVLLKPGVMDPVAQTAETAARDLGVEVDAVRTLRKYWFAGVDRPNVERIAAKVLANDAIERSVVGPLPFERLESGSEYRFELQHVPLAELDDEGLMRLSREGQLYLQLAEMQTIQRCFAELGRDPTDVELETLAQTWSEHCSHKTLAGRIAYRDEHGERRFDNMLKETIFAATQELRRRWGDDDWCVSVFKDNAGIVRFDDQHNICFKVETHNHPSALEPYGGANTGLGGVIRDTLGTGLGAKPIANTDVFCFAPPAIPADTLPPGVLHPQLVMRGVVEGVRDYGNRMGIPTVNGAVYFDERYLGNPLVYCGSVGLIPRDKSFKQPQPHDLIVALGGRTGRDGIHGATFSSAELTHESESLSGGAVQIGNAIEEKKVLDVVLAARDRGLFTAITDCGAGGFSSAVGEMGEEIGAEVWLDKAPLKYAGLSYTEIWISEAQERMVLSVPEENWQALHDLCAAEGVEATVIGRFEPTGRLVLKYQDAVVGDLAMDLLHNGRPPVVRQAAYEPQSTQPFHATSDADYTASLVAILGSLNVASKEAIIRQYDHEVQGGSAIKPLVGVCEDGPGDAAVIRPVLGSPRGVVISCGMNPRYGEFDTYHMAASAIDEAIRNCVAVGADPRRIAVLDNFCWGDCEKNETLGSLVRAALACHDLSLVLETPFISGKDSLNNEFSYVGDDGEKRTIAIPPSLLISAMGQVADVAKCVTMDLKAPGNLLFVVGVTSEELGGSHYALVNQLTGGDVPRVDPARAKATFATIHAAIDAGLVAACHDLSEGGLAAALAEMAFAGGHGAFVDAAALVVEGTVTPTGRLFSESNTRFLCEVAPADAPRFAELSADVPHARIGVVSGDDRLRIALGEDLLVDAELGELKRAWQSAALM
ncbi:MAG: phosphoribosylformylglycinamidine synthase subunit PurL [Pirellulales bacterium]|nr:phosphoribosylformylglycinamidine synthase subunit PurL [Pirellulales bacterium]